MRQCFDINEFIEIYKYEIESKLKKSGQLRILTTDRPEEFERLGSKFLGQNLKAQKVSLN